MILAVGLLNGPMSVQQLLRKNKAYCQLNEIFQDKHESQRQMECTLSVSDITETRKSTQVCVCEREGVIGSE